MGEVGETRHIWMKGDQAVLSPEWSIHSAAATHNYTSSGVWAERTLITAIRLLIDYRLEIINNYNSFLNLTTKKIMNQYLNFFFER